MATLKDLIVTGNSNLSGTLTSQEILPQIDTTYNLGSNDFKWNNIYGTLIGNAATATEAFALTGIDTGNPITDTPGTYKIKYHTNINNPSGIFPDSTTNNAILTLNRANGNYNSQLGFSANGNIYYRSFNNTTLNTTTAWKQLAFTDNNITGAGFANDDTNDNIDYPVKMTLTRNGLSDIMANIPKVSSTSAGVVPKGETVSSQNQDTKFLRSDGTWAKPSYTQLVFTENNAASKAVVTDENGNITTIDLTSTSVSTDPNGTEINFITDITQDAVGKITATKYAIREASTTQSGIISTNAQQFAGNKTFKGNIYPYINTEPNENEKYTLGSSSAYWNGAYISGGGNIHWGNLFSLTYNDNPEVFTFSSSSPSSGNRGLTRIFGSGINQTKPSNALFGVRQSSISIEFTTDGGTNWIEAPNTLTVESDRLFNGISLTGMTPKLNNEGTGFVTYDLGSNQQHAAQSWKNTGIRITVDPAGEGRTGYIDLIVMRVGCNGGGNKAHCVIERLNPSDDNWITVATSPSVAYGNADSAVQFYLPKAVYLTSTASGNNYAEKLRFSFIVDDYPTASRYAPRLMAIAGFSYNGQAMSTGNAATGSEFARAMVTQNTPYLIESYSTGVLGFDSDLVPRSRPVEGQAIQQTDVHTIGTSSRKWKAMYATDMYATTLHGNYIKFENMSTSTGNTKNIQYFDNTSTANNGPFELGRIGYFSPSSNTNKNLGAFYLVPNIQDIPNNANEFPYNGNYGLYISKSRLSWNSKHILRYSSTTNLAANQIIVSNYNNQVNDTDGDVIASDYIITTTAPNSTIENTDTTIPTSYAVWQAISNATPTLYAGSVLTSPIQSFKTIPEVATIKINGNTSGTDEASAKNCTLQYDSTLETLKFVFV